MHMHRALGDSLGTDRSSDQNSSAIGAAASDTTVASDGGEKNAIQGFSPGGPRAQPLPATSRGPEDFPPACIPLLPSARLGPAP